MKRREERKTYKIAKSFIKNNGKETFSFART